LSTSNITEENEGKRNYVEFIISRAPKKNQEALIQLEKKSIEMFQREGIQYDLFLLANNKSWEGFINISQNLTANEDEDVWINILSYKDKKHRDESVVKMSNDKKCQEGYEEFAKLITPGSQIVTGEFNKV
jgi:uncharacterized protein YbaA (DUF1428 family)